MIRMTTRGDVRHCGRSSKIAHQKSRYIFDFYHRRKEISKELYEFCLDQGYADRNLIAKWKKPGYDRLCCLRCMQPRPTGSQLCYHLCVRSPQAPEGGEGYRMCTLRLRGAVPVEIDGFFLPPSKQLIL